MRHNQILNTRLCLLSVLFYFGFASISLSEHLPRWPLASEELPKNLTISLERKGGSLEFDYKVSVDSKGVVTFSGVNKLRTPASGTRHIPPAALRELLAKFEAIKFLNLPGKIPATDCDYSASCSSTAIVSLHFDEVSKTVEDYCGLVGCPRAVEDLRQLATYIDESLGTAKWIETHESAWSKVLKSRLGSVTPASN